MSQRALAGGGAEGEGKADSPLSRELKEQDLSKEICLHDYN